MKAALKTEDGTFELDQVETDAVPDAWTIA